MSLLRPQRRYLFVFLFFIALVVIVGAAIPRSFVVQGLTKLGLPSAFIARPAVSAENPEKAQLLIVYSTPAGFEPSELEARPGQSILMIRNRTGLDGLNYNLKLQPGNGNGQENKSRARRGVNLVTKIVLPAGEALLTEDAHPDWICRIKVVP